MSRGTCHVGTSGWSYVHWAGGVFYPKGLKPREWLPFFARRFTTVEINASFYRLPRREVVQRWREITPARFRFAVKLWRLITHRKRLTDCEQALRDFMDIIRNLEAKRGPLLIQLPPSMKRDVGRLDAFLEDVKCATGRSRWKIAVEFRNTDWLCDEVYELLDRRGAAVCLADMPRCPITEPNNVTFVYIRRHGPGGRYRGCYPPSHLRADAQRIRGWLEKGKAVYVYFNNDVSGHAVRNARELIEAIEQA